MTPIVALVWALQIDNGPADTAPIKQALTDTPAAVLGTEGACKVSGVLPGGERRVGCTIGEYVVGTTLTCKAGESKSATFLMVTTDGPFRIILTCSSGQGVQH